MFYWLTYLIATQCCIVIGYFTGGEGRAHQPSHLVTETDPII